MKRKHFLRSIIPVAFSAQAIAASTVDVKKQFIIPPFLKPGDTIGITAPAGFISLETMAPSIKKLEEWGFRIQMGKTIGSRHFTLSATDKIRRDDFQEMLNNKNIKAILCARGGYGSVRIIDQLNFSTFKKNPKWIIGFSDVTVLHAHINSQFQIASIHSKMCNSFPDDWNLADETQKATINSIYQCLTGQKMQYNAIPSVMNKPGSATAEIVGGNLKTIETLAGSPSDLCCKNKILFVEDTGEYLYSIDRMFWNLKRSGKLAGLKGLIVGGFRVKTHDDADDDFGKTLEEIVLEKITEYNYPVCFNFPVGHQRDNYALKCGVVHHLQVTPTNSVLTER